MVTSDDRQAGIVDWKQKNVNVDSRENAEKHLGPGRQVVLVDDAPNEQPKSRDDPKKDKENRKPESSNEHFNGEGVEDDVPERRSSFEDHLEDPRVVYVQRVKHLIQFKGAG